MTEENDTGLKASAYLRVAVKKVIIEKTWVKENVKNEGGRMGDGWIGVRLSRFAQLFKSPEVRLVQFPRRKASPSCIPRKALLP